MQSFLPGWEYQEAGLPGHSGVCSWRCKGQPKPKRLAWPSKQHLHPAPHTPTENPTHTHSAFLPADSRQAWTLQTFPKTKVMAGEGFPNFDHWPSHQMAQNVSFLTSSKEKSSQQAHMVVVVQGDHPAAPRAGLCCHRHDVVEALMAKSRPGQAGTTRFTGKWHLG